jgi:protein TonB
MSSEERVKAEPCAEAFRVCLVNGDAAENAREKRIKRLAIGISVLLQTAGLAVLLIAPLFAKPELPAERVMMPIPPYSRAATQRNANQAPTGRTAPRPCVYCPLPSIPHANPAATGNEAPEEPNVPGIDNGLTGRGNPTGLLNIIDTRPQPPHGEEIVNKTPRIHLTQIDPALLTRRVEPVFPPLARQLRKSGKVELRAVVATDGSIQSLEVVSGDPLFINSARDAVLQWRYRPSYLNGQPVEIDTYITVIYTLQ